MRLILHQKVYSDIEKIIDYYEQADSQLADEFYEELRHFMAEAAERPESFSIRERERPSGEPAALSLSFSISHRWRYGSDSCCAPSQPAPNLGDQTPLKGRRPCKFHSSLGERP